MRKSKSTLTVDEIPDQLTGSYILTPSVSRETHTHAKDILKLIGKRGEQHGVVLEIDMTPHQTGLKFSWEPSVD